MIFDAHQHFWEYDPARDAWIDETMTALRRDFLPQDLLPELSANDVGGTIAVQSDQSDDETEFLLRLAEQHEWIHGVVGWIDLTSPDVEERLEYYSTKTPLCGFRHIVQSEPVNFMLRKDFQLGISLLKKYEFSYDILIYPRQLPTAIQLVENHPDQTFILDHIAKPDIRSQRMEPWASYMKSLADCPNIYCKLSGIITEADHAQWTKDDIFPYLDTIFEMFGIDRLMFGSDWPVCLLAGSYSEVLAMILEYIKDLSAEDKTQVLEKNTVQAYGIH